MIRPGLRSIFCLLLLSGCATSQYPDQWPALTVAPTGACADLTGTYANFGQQDDQTRILLASLFFPLAPNDLLLKRYERSAVTKVTFEQQHTGDTLVQGWVGQELLMQRLIPAAELTCRDGYVVFHDSSWHAGGIPPFVPIVYHSSIDRLLALAADNSLVIENEELSAGAIVIVPVAATARYWFRFARLFPDAIESDASTAMPAGVRDTAAPAYRLLPPADANEWSGLGDAQACLEKANRATEAPEPDDASMLNGRKTQAFILQDGKDGAVMPSGEVRGNNWIPATHDLRIEKQHWLSPSVADHYAICLLRKGYSWYEVPSTG